MTVMACDFGGTRIKLGLVHSGSVLLDMVLPADSRAPLANRLPDVRNALEEIIRKAGLYPQDCDGIGVGFPSVVDSRKKSILDEFGKFSGGPTLDLQRWAREAWDLPLALENDARLALIGEWQHGAGRGCDDLVMVTLGTGIGTGVIMDGRVVRGRHFQAGILAGHSTINFDGKVCHCGNIGCAETEASTMHLIEVARDLDGFRSSGLSRFSHLDYAAVFHCAAEGDPIALQLRDRSVQVWSALVVNMIHAFDPSRVVIGGGVMGSADIILPAIQDYVDRHARVTWGNAEILHAELGDTAALVGSEWLVEEMLA